MQPSIWISFFPDKYITFCNDTCVSGYNKMEPVFLAMGFHWSSKQFTWRERLSKKDNNQLKRKKKGSKNDDQFYGLILWNRSSL